MLIKAYAILLYNVPMATASGNEVKLLVSLRPWTMATASGNEVEQKFCNGLWFSTTL